MDGFQRRREQKKLDILEAALSLFMKYGVQKVSITEIADKANVSQVTIYNYFEGKQNLINEVLSYYMDKEWLTTEKLIDSDMPFHEKIMNVIFKNKEAAKNIHEDFFQYLMKEYSSGNKIFEDYYTKKALPRLLSFINEGKEKGFIDPSISNEAILFYIQMLNDYMQREEVAQHILPLSEDITKLLFYGIVGKKEEER